MAGVVWLYLFIIYQAAEAKTGTGCTVREIEHTWAGHLGDKLKGGEYES
jgi:hypothetical protein